MDSFFDENKRINVSAIIGENGSGKSSILKLLLKSIYNNYVSKVDESSEYFALFEINNRFYHSGNIVKEIEVDGDFKKTLEFKNESFILYFNYMLDSLKDGSADEWVDNIYHKSDDYTMPLLLEPFKKNNIINISNIDHLTRQRMLLHKSAFEGNEVLGEIFSPTKVKLSIDTDKIIKIYTIGTGGKYTDAIKKAYRNQFQELSTAISRRESLEKSIGTIERRDRLTNNKKISLEENAVLGIRELDRKITELIYEIPTKIINNLYIANKIDKYHENNNRSEVTLFKFYLQEDQIEITIKDHSHNTLKLRNALSYHKEILKNKDIKLKGFGTELDINSDILNIIPSWIEVDFIDEYGSTFSSLSSGEKSMYILISTILYQINNILSRGDLSKGNYDNIIILLDETDLGLHPKWQREYIYNIISSIKSLNCNINVHIICTSHSPFIVSDLPKSNILFLTNGQESVLDNHELTFAENIHTLFNDSFFMKDNLMMGKFAELKIQEIFTLFEKVLKSKSKSARTMENLRRQYVDKRSYFQSIGRIVGDEYIRVAIKNSMLEIDHIFNIDEDEAKLERLSQALESNPELYEKWLNDIT